MRTVLVVLALLIAVPCLAQTPIVGRLDRAIKAEGIPIDGVSAPTTKRPTWRVDFKPSATPAQRDRAMQIVASFNPNDPAYEQADLTTQVTAALDDERLSSAIVWTILKQMFPADTDAQTKTKFATARTRIISAFRAQPWK